MTQNQPSPGQQYASAFMNDMGEGLADGRPDPATGARLRFGGVSLSK